jgi:hypothetical protein
LLARPVRPSLWWALAVFALSAAVTPMGWFGARSEAGQEGLARFRAESERITTHIAGRLVAYEQVPGEALQEAGVGAEGARRPGRPALRGGAITPVTPSAPMEAWIGAAHASTASA